MIALAARRIKHGLWDAHATLRGPVRAGILAWMDKDAAVVRYKASESKSHILRAAFGDDPDFALEYRVPRLPKRVVGNGLLKVLGWFTNATRRLA